MIFWRKRSALFFLLYPFSMLYGLIVFLRRLLFKLNLKKTSYFKTPIIIVGNITVGGSGKTPVVIWLAKFLKTQGLKVGIVSRGYGGCATTWPQAVKANSQPRQVGDEAVLITRQTNCPMVVAPDRVKAVNQLLSDNSCDVVISDDGLQHYALGRAMEIAVIDDSFLLGNGALLPAGPLRESASRLTSVDCIVYNSQHGSEMSYDNVNTYLKKRYRLSTLPMFIAVHRKPGEIYQLINSNAKLDVAQIKRPVHAVSGIANPIRFLKSLRSLGLYVIQHIYKDHHWFEKKEIDFDKNDIIIMTEKDAVKCEAFADRRHWCLPLQVTMSQCFVNLLKEKLSELGILK
jgi:tetraacyldisaccharide 4'-kinase